MLPFGMPYSLNVPVKVRPSALRRDERTQAINDQAARHAFAICMLALGALSVYYAAIGVGQIPAGMLRIILLVGVAGCYVSDLWLRREG